jgi:phosphatidylglycerol:prolipoprotein diacylglycerol transferase
MVFPAYFHILGWRVPPHPVMEVLAYTTGFQLFLQMRRRGYFAASALPIEQSLWIITGAICGAAVGSKLLAWAESAPLYSDPRAVTAILGGGKTIVGGLLGGWIGVEIAKKFLNIRQSTGDSFVFPLILGMAIGRVGCFLTGLSDHTCGLPTQLPWGVDFGDGIPRHPAQLYDILFLMTLATALLAWHRWEVRPNGQLFLVFLSAYLLYRFAIEFLKPRWTPVAGLSMIQVASLVGAISVAGLWQKQVRVRLSDDRVGREA